MLRAPHDAAGALGDCPHCEKEARIPGGAPPPAAAADDFVPIGALLDPEEVEAAREQTAPSTGRTIEIPAALGESEPMNAPPADGVVFAPADARPPAATDGVTFESLDEPPPGGPIAAPSRPVRSRGRRRKKRGSPVAAILVLLMIVGGIGAAGWVMYDRLAGPGAIGVAGRALADDAIPPAYFLPGAGTSGAALAKVEAGVPFESPLLIVELSGRSAGPAGARPPAPDAGGMTDRGGMTDAGGMTDGPVPDDPAGENAADDEPTEPARPAAIPDGAILIRIRPGERGRAVRVSLGELEEVAAWVSERSGDLAPAKRLAFVKARDRFFAAVGEGGNVAPYRDTVALGAATDVLGWSVEAVADGRVAPCCRQTPAGDLLFCLPRGAASFTLRGRELPGLGRAFPFEYVVTVGAPTGR